MSSKRSVQIPSFKILKISEITSDVTCPELSYLQDICNESKHAEITKYKARIKKAHLHRGAFSRGFSGDINISFRGLK